MAKNLSIDIETYSGVDLTKSGLYKYVQSPDFEILLFAYSFDDEPVEVVDLTQKGRTLPQRVLWALQDPNVKKAAFNAAFEWYCINKFFVSPLEQWECTMVHAYYAGYAGGLGLVAEAMGMPPDKKKDTAGKALIKLFCCPNGKKTKKHPYDRVLPKHEPEKWQLFIEYCRQDVVVEKAIKEKLDKYPLPEQEQRYWIMDQAINSGGVGTAMPLIDGALYIKDAVEQELKENIRAITGTDNPNSDDQVKAWIFETAGIEVKSLEKKVVEDVLDAVSAFPEVVTVLNLRKQLKKSSLAKYATLKDGTCADGRFRGMLQFYGAKTGRWAGRAVQPQNLPRNYMATLDTARELVMQKNVEGLKLIYGNVQDTASQLIRTAFVPTEGCIFAVADYSAIEARVIAWLAGENWKLDVFRTHGKIYEASASAMFGVPLKKITKGNPEYELRAKGKVAELALGYQGSDGALIQMGALKMGLEEEELPDIVRRWRASNPRIKDLWWKLDRAAVQCVKYGTPQYLQKGIVLSRDQEYLFITLPSGRQLFYLHPGILPNRWGDDAISYEGRGASKKWVTLETYGGKLTENVVQAIARDCLAEAMYKLHCAGYKICFHVHDEVILEVPKNDPCYNLDNAIKIMCEPPAWAPDLPLNADGFTSDYYKKD
ncbi:DNA polymerase [Eubacterium callanderi]|uniref:DNA-directed DNA polymerase n=1 Tax=Eubacterium callanderi TaxID=53442 RepID=A0AB74EYU7_9FIRM|nr:DNA polymerase [Eubacterium callanderi]MDY7112150.1 hypothetical protein [Eubacterium callanderi]SHL56303.1 DNA polymerase [Eubacterium callanderi]